MSKTNKIVYFLISIVFFIVFDIYFSNLILETLRFKTEENPLIDLIFVQNTGAAFSILENSTLFLIIFSIFAILSILIYKTAFQNWYSFTALIITGLLLSFCILKNIKNETNLTYLPLVPAFSIGALYFLFF